MEKEKLDLNQAPPELLRSFNPEFLTRKRGRDIRFVAGFLMRLTKDDAEKLQKFIKEKFPNISLFYVKLYEPEESIYLVSTGEIAEARLEKNRVEIEGK